MKSSRTITLFTESRDISQRPTSFVVSVLFHCMALGLLSFGVMYTPHLDTRAIAKRYTVRSHRPGYARSSKCGARRAAT